MRSGRAGLLLVLPAAAILAAGFLWPVALLARISFNRTNDIGAMEPALTLETYGRLVEDDFTWELVWNTATLAAGAALAATALALAVALLIRAAPPRWRGLLSLAAVAPLLVSGTARVVGWLAILGDDGVVNGLLLATGLVTEPVRMINNWTGVRIGLTESLMPYACLVLIAGLGRLDARLEEAAATLGATRSRTFLRVTLPLAAPALLAAFLLTLVLGISAFITPKLMGGGRVFVVATEIFDLALESVDWPAAAALAMLLLGALATALVVRGVLRAGAGAVKAGWFLRLAALAAYALLLAPVVVVAVLSFSAGEYLVFPPPGLSLRWYEDLVTNAQLVAALRNSAVLAVLVALVALLAGLPASYAIARLRFPGREAIAALIMAPLLLPTLVLGLALLLMLQPLRLAATWPGLLLAHSMVALPFAVRIMTTAFAAVPKEVEEAAWTLGATPARAALRVTLPIAAPGAAAAAALCFLVSFDETVISLFLVGPRLSTLPIEMFRYTQTRTDPLVAALAMALIIVALTVVLLVERLVGFTRALGRE